MSVTGPLVGNQRWVDNSGVAQVTNTNRAIGRSADLRYAQKVSKYGRCSAEVGLGFEGIIVQSTGFIHESAMKLLKHAANHASEVKKISAGIIYNYLVRTLSVALVRGVASAINNKTFSVTSHNTNMRSDPQWNDDVVAESGRLR